MTKSAISGIDQALMDIKGRALDVPIYELLGGKVRDRLRAYANAWYGGTDSPEEFADSARGMVDAGFTALKFDPFRHAGQMIERTEEEHAFACIDAIAAACGPGVDLLIEAHGRFNVWSAVRVGRRLEPYSPFFYEEPILWDNVDALVEVARAVDVPIATGERLLTRWEFRDLLESNCVRIVQPDVCHTGGISELRKIASMAETYYVAVQPHNAGGPLSTLASIHIDASIPNFAIQEFFYPYLKRYNQLLTDPIVYENGELVVPDGPGMGAEIDEDAAALLAPEGDANSMRRLFPYS